MISVFISSTEDLKHWRWPDGSRVSLDLVKHYAVRKGTMSAIVMSFDYDIVRPFCNLIINGDSTDEAIHTETVSFIAGLRERIKELCNIDPVEPLAVFIHFPGEYYDVANERLKTAWEALEESEKERFCCFAITRSGSNGINSSWIDKTEKAEKILCIPKESKAVEKVIAAGFENWEVKNCFSRELSGCPSPEDVPPAAHPSVTSGAEQRACPCDSTTDDSESPQDEQVPCRKASIAYILLKWSTAIELFAGFILSWVKSFYAQTFISEISFAILGLVFLALAASVLLALREEPGKSSDY